jgi:hypothetical protein
VFKLNYFDLYSLADSKDFFQPLEKPNGKSFNSWVLLSVGDFLFGCGLSALGMSLRAERSNLCLCKQQIASSLRFSQ